MTTIAERVAAGAAFLDEHDPDWWQLIDLPSLDLAAESRCILGQTCPLEVLHAYTAEQWGVGAEDAEDDDRYIAYAYELSGAPNQRELVDWGARHGFTLILTRAGHGASEWDDLTTEWKRVIEQRRSAS